MMTNVTVMSSHDVRIALLGATSLFFVACGGGTSGAPAPAPNATGLKKVRNIVVVMQENHSFDNYLGALPYAPGSPYHPGPCDLNDHACVDGLTCSADASGNLTCSNSNPEADGSPDVTSFHETLLCVSPDLDHGWLGTHHEVNFADPNNALKGTMKGFVSQNDLSEQIDNGESPTEDDTMGFYNQTDLPYYYALAETFAIDDRYFSSTLGPTVPNRLYEFAGTSFGHVVTSLDEAIPPESGYQPINGTIFDRLDSKSVSWGEYVEVGDPTEFGIPYGGLVHNPVPPHFQTIDDFMSQAGDGKLPSVSFVDFGFADSEHPPNDIRAGEANVADVIDAVRKGPHWNESIVILVYDEHGGAYDHVTPPSAPPPDSIPPGQCADNSDPPSSLTPGNGAQCNDSANAAQQLCNQASTGEQCASFDQHGVRVPFIVISPFAKPGYVSHTVGDHTSILSLIEHRYGLSNLTARDGAANDLEDLFDFDNSPSLNANVPGSLAPPPSKADPGCSS
jgi:phospholipase C